MAERSGEKTPLIGTKDLYGSEQQLSRCGATVCCDPRRNVHRYFVLGLICFLSFGSYYCYDNPAALENHIKQDMEVQTDKYVLLYSLYSYPNVILCFFGGFLLDRVFGVRLGTIIFSLFVLTGQLIFALGGYIHSFTVMEIGRFVFGLGGENLAVAQNTYSVSWFKGKELNMVFGLQLSFSRVGSTINMNVNNPIYSAFSKHFPSTDSYKALGMTLFIGAGVCVFSLCCGFLLGFLDKRAARILKKEDSQTGEVIRLSDVKDFPATLWLIFIICVAYYVAIFPFIALGLAFFQAKFDISPQRAGAVNSVVFIISACASPFLGFMVDKVGKNVFWVILSVAVTLGCHCMLAFTFWEPFVAMSIMGVAYSMLACALWPLVALVVPEHQLGTAYGLLYSVKMATKKQPVMEWTDDHDILLLREMIATEFFQCKKGSPDRGKIWESIQERLNKLDNPKFMIKEKRGVRDRWNLLQAKFKRTQREELQASGIDCELSEKDTLIEELCEREDSFSAKDKKKSDDKEAAEEIIKKAMERMKRKSTESAGGSAKKSRRSGGDAVEFLKEKAQSEYSIRQQELELQRKEQEVRARQQELQIELLRKQTEQQVQISQALMTMMQNMVKK